MKIEGRHEVDFSDKNSNSYLSLMIYKSCTLKLEPHISKGDFFLHPLDNLSDIKKEGILTDLWTKRRW